MIFSFLLLKAPVSCSKRFENSPASVKSMIRFITPAKMRFPSVGAFPGCYCPPTQWSPASATARRSCPRRATKLLLSVLIKA